MSTDTRVNAKINFGSWERARYLAAAFGPDTGEDAETDCCSGVAAGPAGVTPPGVRDQVDHPEASFAPGLELGATLIGSEGGRDGRQEYS